MSPSPRAGPGSPRVSVLMPVHDEGEHLPQALATVLEQDLTDIEVVAVNDGSRDGSAEILDAIAERDPRVRVLHRRHAGLVSALQAGLEACRAPLIARMDADDWMCPGRLSAQQRALESDRSLGVCCGGMEIRRHDGAPLGSGMERFQRWQNGLRAHHEMRRDLFVEAPLGHPTAMMRAALLREHGGYRDRGWPEDYDLWMRLFLAGVRFRKLEEPPLVHVWRDGPGRTSAQSSMYDADAFRRLKVHYLRRSHLRERAEAVVWGAGRVGKPFARALQAGGVRVRAFVDLHPRKIGKEIHGAPVIHADDFRHDGTLVLVAVGTDGGREDVRGRLLGRGLRELEHFVCVA